MRVYNSLYRAAHARRLRSCRPQPENEWQECNRLWRRLRLLTRCLWSVRLERGA